MPTVSMRAFFKFLVGFLLVSLLLSSLAVPNQPVAAQPALPPSQSSEEPSIEPLLEYVRGQILYAEGGFGEGLTLQVWREGELVTTAQTGDLGQFSLTGLEAGLYDLQLFAGEQPVELLSTPVLHVKTGDVTPVQLTASRPLPPPDEQASDPPPPASDEPAPQAPPASDEPAPQAPPVSDDPAPQTPSIPDLTPQAQNEPIVPQQTAQLIGRVTALDTGEGLAGVFVRVFNANGSFASGGSADATGYYTITNMAAAAYRLEFATSFSSDPITELYLGEFHANKTSLDNADPVTLTDAVTTTINAALVRGGQISGRVIAEDTSEGLGSVPVRLYNAAGSSIATTFTGFTGYYTFTSLVTDTYRVGFEPRTSFNGNINVYLDEFYNNAASLEEATPIEVGAAVTRTANVSLVRGTELRGRITAADTGDELWGVGVRLYNASGTQIRSASTTGQGDYTFTGLVTGTYRLEVRPQDSFLSDVRLYLGGFYNNKLTLEEATEISATLAAPSIVNVALIKGGQLSGRVTADDGGAALANVPVRLYNAADEELDRTSTGSTGYYTFTGLLTDTYRLEFRPTLSFNAETNLYLDEFYNNQATLEAATPITASVGVTTTANVSLLRGGQLSGRVTAEDGGAALANVPVRLYNANDEELDRTSTGSTGYYTFTGLVTGTYRLQFRPQDSFNATTRLYLGEFYADQNSLENATGIQVTPPAVVTADAELVRGGEINGRVTASDTSDGLANVRVQLYDASGQFIDSEFTGSTGYYTFTTLVSETYRLQFSPPFNSPYLGEFYDDQTSLATATTIPLEPPAIVTANAVLQLGGQISGRVTASDTGDGLAGITVRLSNANGQSTSRTTGSTGYYTFTTLVSETYRLQFSPPFNSPYLGEFYDDQTSLATATPIPLEPPDVVTANAVLQLGGQISGRVTASNTGNGLASVRVRLYNASGQNIDTELTGSTGYYTFTTLVSETYRLEFSPPFNSLYLGEFYDDQASLSTATPIPVEPPDVVTANAVLQLGGQISGRITASDTGDGLAGVAVRLFNTSGNTAATTATDATGQYTITTLATGVYRIEFRTQFANDATTLLYLGEFYNDSPSLDTATGISVTAPDTTTIDAVLQRGAELRGRVRAADTGDGLEDVTVRLVNANGNTLATVDTSATGNYIFTTLTTGVYRVDVITRNAANATTRAYLGQFYNNQRFIELATGINLTVGEFTTLNIPLERGGQISGRVTDADSGDGLAEVAVRVYDATDNVVTTVETDATGQYTVPGLSDNAYWVEFDPRGSADATSQLYVREFHNNQPNLVAATGVSVAAPDTTTINAALERGAQLTGRVTAADDGTGLEDVTVFVYDETGTEVAFGETTATGNYTITGLMSGTYRIGFDPIQSFSATTRLYAGEFHANKLTLEEATPVTLTAPAATTINAALTRGGELSGRVTAADTGNGLRSVRVRLYNTDGSVINSFTSTATGYYTFTGLVTGTYRLEFDTQWFGQATTSLYTRAFYDNKATLDEATAISVTAPTTTTVNAVLARGGQLSGRITGADTGNGLVDVGVQLYDANDNDIDYVSTTNSGYYTFTGLFTGTYRLEIRPQDSFDATVRSYLRQFYDNKETLEEATAISVTAPTTTTVNAALVRGAQLSGRVTAADTGEGLPSVWVSLSDTNSTFSRSVETTPSGYYTFTALVTGTYQLEFRTRTSNNATTLDYLGEFYNNQNSVATATPITLNAPDETNINAELERGAQLTGQVTAEDTSDPLTNVRILVYDPTSTVIAETTTNSSGNYTTTALASGTYRVEFRTQFANNATTRSYLGEFHANQASLFNATVITLTAPGITPINAALARGAQITGQVTAGEAGPSLAQGAALENVLVSAYPGLDTFSSVASTRTDATGVYTLTGLATGAYLIQFGSTGTYLGEWYNDQPDREIADLVSVTAPAVTSNINASLQQGGRIAGRVTGNDGVGLVAVRVNIYDDCNAFLGSTNTNNNGDYLTSVLPVGSYRLEFNPTNTFNRRTREYLPEYYNDKASLETADPIPVAAGGVSANRNAQLTRGGQISGTVTGSGGVPLDLVNVSFYDESGNFISGTQTNPDGTYTSSGLATGSYGVWFFPSSANNAVTRAYLGNWYNNKATQETADPVNVTANTVTPGINTQLTRGGQISGTVTGQAGMPLGSINVRIYSGEDGTYLNQTFTAVDGTYTTVGLPTGTYKVFFTPNTFITEYVSEWYNNKATEQAADPVAVTNGAISENINAELTYVPYGQISGTVTGEGGVPLENIAVQVYIAENGNFLSQLRTDASGNYTVPNLPPGAYNVRFRADTPDLQAYLTEWYNDKAIEADADPVTVNAGATTENINATLTRGGQITGTVTGPDSQPLSGINVQVWASDDDFVTSTSTGNDGTYLTPGVPTGSYKVSFSGNRTYVGQVYNNRTDLAEGDPVAVTLGAVTPAINAQMVLGGTIRGQVLGNGCPLRGVDVFIWTIADPAPRLSDTSATLVGSASTSSSGYYASFALPAGNYHVEFSTTNSNFPANTFVGEFYNGKTTRETADPVATTAGVATRGINADLQTGGQISGRVTDATSGDALDDVQVTAMDSNGNPVGSTARTNATGDYTIVGLPTGSYAVYFEPFGSSSGYLAEYYNGKPDQVSADPVSVTAPATTTGIDASLETGGQITGQVTATSGGAGLPDVQVQAFDADGNQAGATATTDATGTYTITNLRPGTYRVFFEPAGASGGYFPEYYNDKPDLASADPVTVTASQTTSNINASLETGGQITGRVTATSGGNGLPGVQVRAFNADGNQAGATATTDATGTYTITSLRPGTYRVFFEPAGASSGYFPEYYNDKPDLASADPVTVTASQTTSNINASLASGGQITGRVTAASGGAGLAGVHVRIFDSSGTEVVSTTTTATGTYTTPALSSGDYRVFFEPQGASSAYLPIYYDNKPDLATADVVTVGLSTVENINAALARGVQFTGRALRASPTSLAQVGVADVQVNVLNEAGSNVAGATTNANGEFTTSPGLNSGTYRLEFIPPLGSGLRSSVTEPITVTVGTPVDPIEQTLEAQGEVQRVFLPLVRR